MPPEYAREHVELAYATTVYGAQGDTVEYAHLVLGEHTGATSANVGMTRGREGNTAHLVTDTVEDARRQWVDTFARDRADLGPAHAAGRAAAEADKYAIGRPLPVVRDVLWETWTRQADLTESRGRWDRQRRHLAADLRTRQVLCGPVPRPRRRLFRLN